MAILKLLTLAILSLLCSSISVDSSGLLESFEPNSKQSQNKIAQGIGRNGSNMENSRLGEENRFRFDRNFSISDPSYYISDFALIGNDSVALNGISLPNTDREMIKLFSGPDYQTAIGNITSPISRYRYSKTKYFGDKVYLSFGQDDYTSIATYSKESFSKKSYKFSKQTTYTNSPLVTDKFILIHDGKDCPSFLKIDRRTMESDTVYPDPDQKQNCECARCQYGYFKDLQNGKIAYAVQFNLYILNANTLEIQQKFNRDTQFYGNVEYIDTWYDKITGSSTLLAKGASNNQIFFFNSQTSRYESSTSFSSLSSRINLVGHDEGYSSYNGEIFHWSLNGQFLYVDQNNSKQGLYYQSSFVGMARNESYFIVGYNDVIEIYSLDEKSPSFEIKLLRKVNFSLGYAQSKLPKLTSDDRYVFLNYPSASTVVIYDIVQDKTSLIKDTKCIDFALMDSKFDRFILLRDDTRLQIRKISDPLTQFKIFPLQVPTQTKIYQYKLVNNPNWGLQFLVLFGTGQFSGDQDSLQQMCNIEGDVLACNEVRNERMYFSSTFATSKWLVSFIQDETISNVYSIKVFNWTNFGVVQSYPSKVYNSKQSSFLYSDTLLMKLSTTSNELISLDLISPEPVNFQMRTMFSQFLVQNKEIKSSGILFTQKNLFYVFGYAYWGQDKGIKVIYNGKFPVDKRIKQGGYATYLQKRNGQECDWLLSVEKNNLIVKRNCEPYTEVQMYPLDYKKSLYPEVYECSDKKHIVVSYLMADYWTYSIGKFEIRQIGNWSKIVWQKIYSTNDAVQQSQELIYNIDLMADGQVLINHFNRIQIIGFEPQLAGIQYDLRQINDFTVGQNQVLAMFGSHVSWSDQNQLLKLVMIDKDSKLIYEKNITNGFYLGYESFIALNRQNSLVAICYQQSINLLNLQVWNISSDEKIFELQLEGERPYCQDLKFLNQTHLLSRMGQVLDKKNVIIPISPSNTNSKPIPFTSLPTSRVYTFSNDGRLIAFINSSTTVDIYDQSPNLLSRIAIPLPSYRQLSFLAFFDNNTLLVVDNQTNIFVFNQSPCPDTFFLNSTSYCVCRNYSTLSGKSCQCNSNFIQSSEGLCECLDPFLIQSSSCSCRKNQTQVGNDCQCNNNFVKKDLECLCQKPFLMLGQKCVCPQNTTQQLNQCLCSLNFVSQNDTCVCPPALIYLNGQCSCGQGNYISGQQCVKCSFICKKCEGGSFSCTTFSIGFYFIVIGSSLLVVGIILVTVIRIRKAKIRKGKTLLEDDQSQNTGHHKTESKDQLTEN